MNEKRPTLIIIDGSSVIYRAFHAIPQTITNRSGMPTNAIYGFTQTLRKILADWKPDYIGVAFDVKGPSFRRELFTEYKATRPPMPDALQPQIPFIKRIVTGYGIPVLEKEGYEADDIIATLVKRLGAQVKTRIVTGDKDMYQLVGDNVVILDYLAGKEYGTAEAEAKFGVSPALLRDLLGLAGDSSDNIPGVPGIGPKTAVKLIAEFGSIEDIYANIEKVSSEKLREKLRANKAQAELSKELATLHPDVDFDADLKGLRMSVLDKEQLVPLFRELDFKKFLAELETGQPPVLQPDEGPDAEVVTGTGVEAEARVLKTAGRFALSLVLTETGPGLSVCSDGTRPAFIPLDNGAIERLRGILEDDKLVKDTDDSKALYLFFMRHGVRLRGIRIDASLASYIIDPSRNDHSIDALKSAMLNLAPHDGAQGVHKKACDILKLADLLDKQLNDDNLMGIYAGLELPTAEVLASMELAGIKVETEILRALSKEMASDLAVMEAAIYEAAGTEFNINSPKQLSEVLFERLGLKPVRKTKTGFSTDEEVLRQLSNKHKVPELILSFRQTSKLKSTYVDAILELVDPADGRVHTSFNQTVTATGRLSSSRPNLQNIPTRTPSALRIREAFVAPEGFTFLSADYSQIELRIVAHLSQDAALMDAFIKDEDVHTATASEVFGVLPGLVTPELRHRAKAINFGIIYGMGAYGLSSELNCSVKEAESYIAGYFAHYKAVKAFIDRTIEEAKAIGYTTTLFGRRRYIPELASPVDAVKRFGERMAVNTPIQGAAADMIKAAMVSIHKRLNADGAGRSRMLLQIHDELIFETPVDEAASLAKLVKVEMEDAIRLSVPVKVNIKQGANWRVVE
ncbi:MAG: DNA polymerase I [Deltaproteobacteria bacterium]|nr:DNA polymerase I [Deltaproteobacteria bacterium]